MTSMMEPMDVDLLFQDEGDNGEDEMHPDILKENETSSFSSASIIPETRYENKGGTFTTGIDIFSKDEQRKMIERAKRFGLKNDGNSSMALQEPDLYTNMGVDEDSGNSKYVRLNALHMRGTEDMSTRDVFEYFGIYAPLSIEWINDVSCNVVWLDKISAARALLGLSKRIVEGNEKNERNSQQKLSEGHCEDEDNISSENSFIPVTTDDKFACGDKDKDKSDNTISLSAIDFPLPPGVWRKGVEYPKSKTILLRFATSSDKKQQNSEKLSDYYKKYGNPNFGGMKGILTDSRKRMYKQTRPNKRRQSSETNNKVDANRMKNPWGALSETWGTNDIIESDFIRRTRPHDNRNDPIAERGSIKKRLGSKSSIKEPSISNESLSDDNSDDDDDWNKRSKVLRMRMHADDEEEKVQKKRLKQLTKKVQEKVSGNDLRSRLERIKSQSYRKPIQVIVTYIPERYRNSRQLNNTDKEVDETKEDIEAIEVEEDEKEEGEWEEDETMDMKNKTVKDVTDQDEEQSVFEQEEREEVSNSDTSSDMSEKEVQGPRGSVIKVIPRAKPRVASTVWARLNQDVQRRNSSNLERRDLRVTLKSDVRSRLGYHKRERSPLRIEVKNDKYAQDNSESE